MQNKNKWEGIYSLDDPSRWGELILLVLLILLSSFFSGTETALVTLGKYYLKKDNKVLISLLKEPQKTLTTILVGNMFVNVFASSLGTYIAISKWGEKGLWLSTLFMTFVILLFGEISPKSIAIHIPEKISSFTAYPLKFFTIIFHPIVFVLTKFVSYLSTLLGIKNDEENFSEEEINILLSLSKENGILKEEERKMIEKIMKFGNTTVREIMVPRIKMECLPSDLTVSNILDKIKEINHSRIPIYEEKIDNIIGILYIKDLSKYLGEKRLSIPITEIMRKAYFIPENKRADRLLQELIKKNIQIAIVIDEYGGTAGLITMEDLMEEIVGEIQDEYDKEEAPIKKISENTYIVDSLVNLYTLHEELGIDLQEKDEDFDTLGGLIFKLTSHIPKEGEKIKYKNAEFEILKVEKNRIQKVKITIEKDEEQE